MKIQWIGQGGFVFEFQDYRFVIDPYLSDSLRDKGATRMVDPPLDAKSLHPDAMFFTHDHLDHFDEATVLPVCKAAPECRLLGPDSVADHINQLELRNPVTQFAVGDVVSAGPFKLTILPAWHSDPTPVGVLIEVEGRAIYLSGDSLLDPKLIPAVRKASPAQLDAVIICINGKLNNMSWQDALKVVDALKPKIGIPMHYGMFYENTVDPRPFLQGCSEMGMRGVELTVGKEIEFETLLK
jgi:L-ascorbate metabolism protein UlaG (beta-lactamase superfamily)